MDNAHRSGGGLLTGTALIDHDRHRVNKSQSVYRGKGRVTEAVVDNAHRSGGGLVIGTALIDRDGYRVER